MWLISYHIVSHQVNRRTMRERMAAARMISTLVSRPASEPGQGTLQYIDSKQED